MAAGNATLVCSVVPAGPAAGLKVRACSILPKTAGGGSLKYVVSAGETTPRRCGTMRTVITSAVMIGAAVALAGAAGAASQTVKYGCDNGKSAKVKYVNPKNGESSARLTIGGKRFTLTAAPSASGARYTSPDGLTEGQGLEWWEKGGEALLSALPLDEADQADDTTLIATCTEK
jgi:membrane-bound inhibitor of C-type lysozyme